MKQFNWSRRWKDVEPYLQHHDVQFALDLGMAIHNPKWKHGDAPCNEGAIGCSRIVKGKLSWYQPLNRCHWIAPFSWAIGQKLYPELIWGFLTSQHHTVAVGTRDNIDVVMDILLFNGFTADESVEHVKCNDWKLCYTIQDIFVGTQA